MLLETVNFTGYGLIRRTLDYCACSLSCSQPEYSVCSTGKKQKREGTGMLHKHQGIRNKLDLKKISNGLSRVSQLHPFPSTLTAEWLTALSSPVLQAIKYCSSKVSTGHYGSNHFGKWCLKRARILLLTYFKFLTESVIAIHV